MQPITRLPRIKRITGLERLPDLGGKSKRRKKTEPIGLVMPVSMSGADDEEKRIAWLYGDERLAARVRKLQYEFPDGSVPELVALDWLRWKGIDFYYQAQLFGGWGRSGGLVPDFLLLGPYMGRVWLIQGDYWHTQTSKQASDATAKLKLIGAIWNGVEIKTVTSVWEGNLRDGAIRQRTLDLALVGIEMPGG